MGIDRIEHFMGGDAISADKRAYSSLERSTSTRRRSTPIIEALPRAATCTTTRRSRAYGYWYDPKDMRVFTTWDDEMSYLTPHAREVVEARLPQRPTTSSSDASTR